MDDTAVIVTSNKIWIMNINSIPSGMEYDIIFPDIRTCDTTIRVYLIFKIKSTHTQYPNSSMDRNKTKYQAYSTPSVKIWHCWKWTSSSHELKQALDSSLELVPNEYRQTFSKCFWRTMHMVRPRWRRY